MNEFDAMRLLGEANPVQAQDLAPLDAPDRFRSRVRDRRLVAAIAITALAAAALIGVFAFNGSDSARRGVGRIPRGHVRLHGPTGANGVSGLGGPTGLGGVTGALGPTGSIGPTGSRGPIGRSGPRRPTDPTATFYADGPTGATGPTFSLADAKEALGADVVLPDVAPIDASGVGKITEDCEPWFRDKRCDVDVAFPPQRVWIDYQPSTHWSGSKDPLAAYRNSMKYNPSGRVVYLSGTPAYIGSDGRNVEFVLGGAHIRVWVVDPVPAGGPTLQAIAQSIVDRSK